MCRSIHRDGAQRSSAPINMVHESVCVCYAQVLAQGMTPLLAQVQECSASSGVGPCTVAVRCHHQQFVVRNQANSNNNYTPANAVAYIQALLALQNRACTWPMFTLKLRLSKPRSLVVNLSSSSGSHHTLCTTNMSHALEHVRPHQRFLLDAGRVYMPKCDAGNSSRNSKDEFHLLGE